MSLLSWVGRTIGFGTRDRPFWNLLYGGGSYSGRTVTVEDALKLSAWWACVRLNAQIVATLPAYAYGESESGRVRDLKHPINRILRSVPNSRQTSVEFWENMIAPLFITGNSYARKVFNAGRLTALNPIPWDRCYAYEKDDGAVFYKWTDRGEQFDVPAAEIFHLKGFGTGGLEGLSPVAYARNTIGGAMDTDEASARMFGSGMRASGFMLSPGTLTAEQRADAKKNLIKPLEGPQAEGKIGLLEGGWKFQAANIPAKDAEMLLSRKYNVEDVCRWMGTPPILIGHAGEGQTMWGSGIEQILLGWLTTQLGPLLTRIEAACNRSLFSATEQGKIFVDFDEDSLLRADSAGRAALFSSYAQNGLRTRDELRALDKLGPLPGGDILTVQSALVPLRTLGQLPKPAENSPQDPLAPKDPPEKVTEAQARLAAISESPNVAVLRGLK